MGTDRKLEELERKGRQHGFPLTLQRRMVLELLAGRKDHPTADQIYEALRERAPHLSRTTVYRVLEKLAGVQLIRRISGLEAKGRFDADTTRHHHLQCIACGAIFDFRADLQEFPMPQPQEVGGFVVTDMAVSFTGTCASCRSTATGSVTAISGKGGSMKFITIEEIINFAVQREETAYRLYLEAAQKSSSIASKKMFEEMAAEEAGHKKVFSKVEIAEAASRSTAGIPDSKIAEYLADIPLRADMTYDEIIRNGIKTEESAWKLYTAAAEATEDPSLKKILLTFAEVEKGHKKRLQDLYDERVLTEN